MKKKYDNIPLPVKAGFAFLVCSVLQSGLNILTLPLFTRILTTEQYGVSSNYFAWNDIFAILCTFRFSYGVFDKGMVVYDEAKDKFQSALLGLSMTITLFFALIFTLTYEFYGDYIGIPLWLCMTMIIYQLFSPALLFWTNRSKFDYRYKAYSIIIVITSLLCTFINLGSVILLPGDKGILKILSYQIVWTLVNGIVAIATFLKGKCFYNKNMWRYALGYNIPLLPYFLSTVILDKADRIMISNICEAGDVALYSVSYNLANLMILFTSAIGGAFTPWIYKKIKCKEYDEIPRVSNTIILIFIGVSSVFMLFAPELIRLFASSEYSEAIYVIPPVVASNFFILLYSLVSKIEYYFEKTKVVAFISIFTALLNIFLNYLFIPRFGYIAAAYTTLISYIASTVLHCFFSNRIANLCGIKETIYSWKVIVGLSIIMMISTILVNTLYDCLMARYIVISLLILIAIICKNRILTLFSTIKG